MIKIKEILRLREQGLNVTQVSVSCNCSRETVKSYWEAAQAIGLQASEVELYSEDELRIRLNKKSAGRCRQGTIEEHDWSEVSRKLSKKGMTLRLLWEDLQSEQASVMSYSNFCLRYREWRKEQKITYRQIYKGGEKLFVDFSGLTVPLEGGGQAEIFVGALGASNLTYVEATENQGISCWLGSHVRMLNYLGGVPAILVPDNLRSGVTNANYYEPDINRSYQEFAEHYGLAIIPARVRKPQDKAKVEEAVQHIQRRILVRLTGKYRNVAEVNEAIRPLLEELNNHPQQVYGVSRWKLFEDVDKAELKELPQHPYVFSKWAVGKVNIDFHVEVAKHYYSVPYTLAHKTVDLRIKEKTVEIFYNNQRVATHVKVNEPGHHSTLSEHIPEKMRRITDQTPRKFLLWAEIVGKETHNFVHDLFLSKTHVVQGYRACLGLQRLEKTYGRERLDSACLRANYYGLKTMSSIRTILESGQDKTPLEPDEPLRGHELHENVRGDSYYH